MNEQIRELAKDADIDWHRYWNDDGSNRLQIFGELIVRNCIDEMITQMWNYGIDESNNPSFYKAVERTKQHFGVKWWALIIMLSRMFVNAVIGMMKCITLASRHTAGHFPFVAIVTKS